MNKILFIDEEEAIVKIYRDVFEKKGDKFITTFNIKEALDLTRTERPDVVLLDIVIPLSENVIAEQGYDYLKRVKIDPETKDIPVIVFSNLDTPQDRKKCRDLGASAFIFKRDCSPKEVIIVVDEIIKRSKK